MTKERDKPNFCGNDPDIGNWKPISTAPRGRWVVIRAADADGNTQAMGIASYGVRPSLKGDVFDVVGGDLVWRSWGCKQKAFPLEPTEWLCTVPHEDDKS
jgi:hypothetical protein